MKKVVKIIAIILLVVWAVLASVVSFVMVAAHSDLQTRYDELEASQQELTSNYMGALTDKTSAEVKSELEGTTIEIRAIGYEVLFELLYKIALKKETIDVADIIEQKSDNYGLSDTEVIMLQSYILDLGEKYALFD